MVRPYRPSALWDQATRFTEQREEPSTDTDMQSLGAAPERQLARRTCSLCQHPDSISSVVAPQVLRPFANIETSFPQYDQSGSRPREASGLMLHNLKPNRDGHSVERSFRFDTLSHAANSPASKNMQRGAQCSQLQKGRITLGNLLKLSISKTTTSIWTHLQPSTSSLCPLFLQYDSDKAAEAINILYCYEIKMVADISYNMFLVV